MVVLVSYALGPAQLEHVFHRQRDSAQLPVGRAAVAASGWAPVQKPGMAEVGNRLAVTDVSGMPALAEGEAERQHAADMGLGEVMLYLSEDRIASRMEVQVNRVARLGEIAGGQASHLAASETVLLVGGAGSVWRSECSVDSAA